METTLYIKEPVSVKPEKEIMGDAVILLLKNGQKRLLASDHINNHWENATGDCDYYLKPVSVSEVPDDAEIMKQRDCCDFAGRENPEAIRAAKWMRDTMLPHFALLKEEAASWKEKALYNAEFNTKEAQALKEENEKLKARVSELEGERELISVNDRLPENRKPVICLMRSGLAVINSYEFHTDQDDRWFKNRFTHWMLLPDLTANP